MATNICENPKHITDMLEALQNEWVTAKMHNQDGDEILTNSKILKSIMLLVGDYFREVGGQDRKAEECYRWSFAVERNFLNAYAEHIEPPATIQAVWMFPNLAFEYLLKLANNQHVVCSRQEYLLR